MSDAAGRPAPRSLTAPAVALAAVGAATAYVAEVDPNRPGHYPTCPFLLVTGWWCPACGGLRCVHELTRGDLSAALHDNVLVVVSVVLATAFWVRWTYRAAHGRRSPVPGVSRRWLWGLIAVLVAFTVLRNLPSGSFLAPPSVPLSQL